MAVCRASISRCRDQAVALIPWSPLARGFPAGNRTRDHKGETTRSTSDPFTDRLYYRDEDFKVVERVTQVAQNNGVTNMQIALAWMFSKRAITSPITGASKRHHLPEAIAALEIKLSAEEIKSMEELYQPHPVLGHS